MARIDSHVGWTGPAGLGGKSATAALIRALDSGGRGRSVRSVIGVAGDGEPVGVPAEPGEAAGVPWPRADGEVAANSAGMATNATMRKQIGKRSQDFIGGIVREIAGSDLPGRTLI